MACEPGETVGAFLCQAGQVLRAAGIEQPRFEARLLLAHATGATQEQLLRDPRAPLAHGAAERFEALVRARAARVPAAHLLGETGFWTLTIRCTPDVLVPRADTEALVEAALDAFPDRGSVRRVLDLGTGTGALLLAALSEFPAASGAGVDRSEAAAAVARGNAARNGLSDRAVFVVCDWASAVVGRFDLILSNPPYIAADAIPHLMPEVARHEPRLALDGGADGLDGYRALAQVIPRLLASGGRAIFEIGPGQAGAVAGLASRLGLTVNGVRDDLGGVPRALVLAAP